MADINRIGNIGGNGEDYGILSPWQHSSHEPVSLLAEIHHERRRRELRRRDQLQIGLEKAQGPTETEVQNSVSAASEAKLNFRK